MDCAFDVLTVGRDWYFLQVPDLRSTDINQHELPTARFDNQKDL